MRVGHQDGGDDDEYAEDDDEPQGYDNEDEEYEEPDRESIERILQMLESQEEESLKNNREVIRGKEGGNGW